MGWSYFICFIANLMAKKRKTPLYLYRIRPVAKPETAYGETVIRTGDQEIITGQINGEKASDLEERVANSLSKFEIPFEFRARITSQALGRQRLTSSRANVRGEI